MRVAGNAPQDRIHEAGGARFPGSPCHGDRVVDGRGGRHAIEMNQLIRAQTENLENLTVKLCQGSLGELGDQVIELSLPAQRTGDEVGRQCSIAFVLKRGRTSTRAAGRSSRPAPISHSAVNAAVRAGAIMTKTEREQTVRLPKSCVRPETPGPT